MPCALQQLAALHCNTALVLFQPAIDLSCINQCSIRIHSAPLLVIQGPVSKLASGIPTVPSTSAWYQIDSTTATSIRNQQQNHQRQYKALAIPLLSGWRRDSGYLREPCCSGADLGPVCSAHLLTLPYPHLL